jgi:alpha-tubulin suppressor-like RCC1 family protein
MPPATAVSAGDSYHACALLADGGVSCWGDNQFGQLGNDSDLLSLVPVRASELTNAVSVSVNSFNSCAVTSDGAVECWGAAGDGIISVAADDARVPTRVDGIDDAVSVTLGSFHACALRSDATVACWGRNYELELGNSAVEDESPTPLPVEGLTDVVSLSAGFDHTCAVRSDGTVFCWGANGDGQLGTGEKARGSLPAPVRGLRSAISVGAGWSSTCAVLENHTARCWGYNDYGSLGDGTTKDSFEPVTVLEF